MQFLSPRLTHLTGWCNAEYIFSFSTAAAAAIRILSKNKSCFKLFIVLLYTIASRQLRLGAMLLYLRASRNEIARRFLSISATLNLK